MLAENTSLPKARWYDDQFLQAAYMSLFQHLSYVVINQGTGSMYKIAFFQNRDEISGSGWTVSSCPLAGTDVQSF